MNLKQIEAFVEIAEGKSFSQAAKKLYLTQPTISAHIAALEKDLNTRLFNRNTKEVNLSDDGKRLYTYAVEMMRLQKKIYKTFEAKVDNPGFEGVKVGSSTVPAQYILPDLMGEFAEQNTQGVEIQIVEGQSVDIVEAVLEEDVEVGFVGTCIPKDNLEYIPLMEDEMVVVMPNTKSFVERYENRTDDLEWLRNSAYVFREHESGTGTETLNILVEMGVDPRRIRVVAQVESNESAKRLVGAGWGISIMSKLSVKEDIECGKLLEVDVLEGHKSRKLHMVHKTDKALSKEAQVFVEYVKATIK